MSYLLAAYLAIAVLAGVVVLAVDDACLTDTECAAQCAMDLPPDHPDYCDGGLE